MKQELYNKLWLLQRGFSATQIFFCSASKGNIYVQEPDLSSTDRAQFLQMLRQSI